MTLEDQRRTLLMIEAVIDFAEARKALSTGAQIRYHAGHHIRLRKTSSPLIGVAPLGKVDIPAT
jgi:hypothetical protein